MKKFLLVFVLMVMVSLGAFTDSIYDIQVIGDNKRIDTYLLDSETNGLLCAALDMETGRINWIFSQKAQYSTFTKKISEDDRTTAAFWFDGKNETAYQTSVMVLDGDIVFDQNYAEFYQGLLNKNYLYLLVIDDYGEMTEYELEIRLIREIYKEVGIF